jgi:hypothetical protein
VVAEERMSEERDLSGDLKQLEIAYRSLLRTTPRMRRPTLEFLWDRFVAHPPAEPEATAIAAEEKT